MHQSDGQNIPIEKRSINLELKYSYKKYIISLLENNKSGPTHGWGS